jgi:hypothetical protein
MRIPLAPHTLTTGEAFILQNNNEKSLYKVTHTNNNTITAELKHTTNSATAPQTITGTLHNGTLTTTTPVHNTRTPKIIDLTTTKTNTIKATTNKPEYTIISKNTNEDINIWQTIETITPDVTLVQSQTNPTQKRIHLTPQLQKEINTNTTNLTPTHTFYLANNNTECVPHDAAKALKTIINHPHWNALKQKAVKNNDWEATLTTDYLTDTYWEQISTDYSDGYAWGVSYDLIIDYTIDYAEELKHLTNSTEPQTPNSKNLTPKQQKQLTTMLNNIIKKLEQSEWYEPDPEDYTIIPYIE